MARPLAAFAALAALTALVASCSLVRPLHGLTCEPGAANASCLYGQACDADADCATASCSAGKKCQCPGDMEPVDGLFCIDHVEVTNEAYRTFQKTNPNPSSQDTICAWNKHFSFGEDVNGPPTCMMRHQENDYPASCLNWCQASAFCKSRGKRLCGKIHGGTNPIDDHANPTKSEWFDACSNGGTRVFPMGDDLDHATCNTESEGTLPAGAPGQENCEGGPLGVQNMSGNVREWEDSCVGEVGDGDTCLLRGGSFDSGEVEAVQCDALDETRRDDTDPTIGFRCCSG